MAETKVTVDVRAIASEIAAQAIQRYVQREVELAYVQLYAEIRVQLLRAGVVIPEQSSLPLFVKG